MQRRTAPLARRTGSALVVGTMMTLAAVTTVVLLAVGCGKTDSSIESSARDSGGAAFDGDSPDVTDATSATKEDGSTETVPCGECVSPGDICIDDSTMRTIFSLCGDSGTCEVRSYDTPCPMTGVQPYCFNGGCRVLVLR